MKAIPAALRRLVVRRAGNRCEYCRLSQEGQEATFHVDHIVPASADGETVEENLAWACVSCSLRKESRQTGLDPQRANALLCFIRVGMTGTSIFGGTRRSSKALPPRGGLPLSS
jgi:hypothetical protein